MTIAQAASVSSGALQLCSLTTGRGLFGIDTSQVREVLGPTHSQLVPLAKHYVDGIIAYRGEALTTISFRALLGLPAHSGPSSILVLDDQANCDRFGLAVDSIGGVVTVAPGALEANPGTLDSRGMNLFDGVYQTRLGMMTHLNSQRLCPSRLANLRMFDDVDIKGESSQ